ncbi:DUF4129 domain-containing protein [Microbacterium sp. LB12]|uniref:DUF4129 domain-containing protein n=1 Tax=Microbacterium sp. LB12 TaxID=3081270 RepID=UPI00301B06C0
MSRSEPPAPEQEHVGTRPRIDRLLVPLIGIAGFFAVVMFAASAQGTPQFGPWPIEGAEPTAVDNTPAPMESAPPPPPPEQPADSAILAIIGYVAAALIVAAVLAMVYLGVRYLLQLWRNRPLARRGAADVAVEVVAAPVADADPDAAVIRRGIDEALRTIDERPEPGDSIVAAWVGLEESAADAGAGRAANETPSEFTVRIIGRRKGIADEVVVLLRLYEEVRFGGHVADDDDRARAATCLRGIQEGWR